MKRQRGFLLLEFLIVLALIVLLSGLLALSFVSVVQAKNESSALQAVKELVAAENNWHAQWGGDNNPGALQYATGDNTHWLTDCTQPATYQASCLASSALLTPGVTYNQYLFSIQDAPLNGYAVYAVPKVSAGGRRGFCGGNNPLGSTSNILYQFFPTAFPMSAPFAQCVLPDVARSGIDQGPTGHDGPRGGDGKDGPAGADGHDGQNGHDSTVPGPKGDQGLQGLSIVGPQGDPGSNGQDGLNGAPGSQWYFGTAAPNQFSPSANPQDYYLNTTTYDIYKRGSGTNWAQIGNIKGSSGGNASLTGTFAYVSSSTSNFQPLSAPGNIMPAVGTCITSDVTLANCRTGATRLVAGSFATLTVIPNSSFSANGTNVRVTLFKNGAATALTCNAVTGAICTVTVAAVSVVSTDQLTVAILPTLNTTGAVIQFPNGVNNVSSVTWAVN